MSSVGLELDQIDAGDPTRRWRAGLAADDRPTAIQISGADPRLLLAAARIAAAARPSFLDLNCGCWVPSVVGRGAGAAWLRDPAAMVEVGSRRVREQEVGPNKRPRRPRPLRRCAAEMPGWFCSGALA